MNATATAAHGLRLPAAFLPAVRRALAQDRSPLEAATLLRQVGYDSGAGFHAALEERIAWERPGATLGTLPEGEFWPEFSAFWQDAGWGTVRHVQLHPGVAALECDGWAEAAAAREAGDRFCHLTTGIFADLLGRLAGSDVAVMEVECEADGGDRCRFLFGGPAALAAVYEGMSQGMGAGEAVARLG
ncbi:MAG TPA: V4R domain-containing protein [Longimicrobiaceae bacterium]|nr:V4R domain-containing protein [Longimicrobiaceae bacterium]